MVDAVAVVALQVISLLGWGSAFETYIEFALVVVVVCACVLTPPSSRSLSLSHTGNPTSPSPRGGSKSRKTTKQGEFLKFGMVEVWNMCIVLLVLMTS